MISCICLTAYLLYLEDIFILKKNNWHSNGNQRCSSSCKLCFFIHKRLTSYRFFFRGKKISLHYHPANNTFQYIDYVLSVFSLNNSSLATILNACISLGSWGRRYNRFSLVYLTNELTSRNWHNKRYDFGFLFLCSNILAVPVYRVCIFSFVRVASYKEGIGPSFPSGKV